VKTLTIVAIAGVAIVGAMIVFGTSQGNQQQEQLEKIAEEQEAVERNLELEDVSSPKLTPSQPQPKTLSSKNCSGSAGCFTDYVTRIVDGDTIHTATLKIRLSLTNTPETYQEGFNEATKFTKKLCPVGSEILVDQDDLQRVDKYGRVLAKVFCGDKVLNSELLFNGHAKILTQYCSTSEFSGEAWAKRYGCTYEEPSKTTTPSTQTQQPSCDPSYPDFCIPPPPKDIPNPIKIIPKIKLAVPIMFPNYFELDYKLRIFRLTSFHNQSRLYPHQIYVGLNQ